MQTLKNELEKLNEQVKYNNQLNYQLLMSNIIANLEFKDIKDKEILLLLLQNRDRNYVRINNNQQCYENIKRYLSILRPLKLPLQDLVRIGGESDGGYVMMNMKNMGGGKLFL
ncbi:hypothetical protein CINS5915_03160 [Campylobacter insulaenigrae]|uniref:hypothetical protein n=1 Tax=Campylobacter insulaenigrae TaxID=260714 RepID=UPI0021534F7C|nr:hypothetical protein [Campylobacter insulaenigrae]MCR6575364.1 hypothetical protein [Campylobacter insulaenigrae]